MSSSSTPAPSTKFADVGIVENVKLPPLLLFTNFLNRCEDIPTIFEMSPMKANFLFFKRVVSAKVYNEYSGCGAKRIFDAFYFDYIMLNLPCRSFSFRSRHH